MTRMMAHLVALGAVVAVALVLYWVWSYEWWSGATTGIAASIAVDIVREDMLG